MKGSSFMDKIQNILEKSVVPVASKIGSQRHLASVRDGLTILVPITIIGGFAILFAMPPVGADMEATNIFTSLLVAWRDWAAAYGAILMVPYYLTIGIISIYVVLGVAYRLCVHYEMDIITNVITALLVFLCVAAIPEMATVGDTQSMMIPLTNLGAGGMFTAILVAIIVIEINRLFMRKNIVIKLPESVPPNVAAPFNVLIPGIANLVLFIGLNAILESLFGFGVSGLVYAIFQPLISATGSLPSIIFINILMTTFWFFGIHGSNMVGVVVTPLTTLGLTMNAEAYANGQHMDYIFAGAVNSVYGGWISYLALVIVVLVFCKATQSKSVAKVALVPTVFNINEPLIFGLPTVLNPYTYVFFIIANNVNFAIVYYLMDHDLLGKFFIMLPFTVPGPLQAWLASMDPRSIIVWFALLALDIVIAIPIIKVFDKELLKQEAEY